MSEAKKRKVHLPEFEAKVGLQRCAESRRSMRLRRIMEAPIGMKLNDFDQRPDPGSVGLRHSPGNLAQQAGQGNAFLAGYRKRSRLVLN